MRARGRTRRAPGAMNGLEKAWSEHLECERLAGRIASWYYEPINFRLAKKCFYKPDFLVCDADGFIELHELKGHFEEQSKVRLKVVSEKYPEFVFRLIRKRTKKQGGGFEVTVIGPEL